MRFSLQKVLTLLGVSILVAIVVSALTYRASETANEVPVDFPGALIVQVRNEEKTSTMTFVLTQAGREWFSSPEELVVADSPLRLTTHDLANGILTDAVRGNFSTLLNYDEIDVWQLEANALAAFIEVIGGYEVNGQMFEGNEAVDSLRFSESGSGYRFLALWRSIVQNLDAGELPEILANLGSTSRSNRSIEELVSYFGSLQATSRAWPSAILEVKYIEGSVNGRIGLYLTEKSRIAIIKSIQKG